ncbi:hypothetical protein JB92DRAFT_3259143 [Gautieria morchelliformis]|nr:hypothetical protein JB92DRAFT_3259143 [Gautieria morchelliformis]
MPVRHAPSPTDPGRGERDVGIAQPWNSRQSKRISETFQSVECGDEEEWPWERGSGRQAPGHGRHAGRGRRREDPGGWDEVEPDDRQQPPRDIKNNIDRSIGAGHMRHGHRTQPRGRGGPHEQDPKTQKDVTYRCQNLGTLGARRLYAGTLPGGATQQRRRWRWRWRHRGGGGSVGGTGVHGASETTPWTRQRVGGAPRARRMIQEERMWQIGQRRRWRGTAKGDRGASRASRHRWGAEDGRGREGAVQEKSYAVREELQSERRVEAREESKREKSGFHRSEGRARVRRQQSCEGGRVYK